MSTSFSNVINSGLSIMHLNVQSIIPKIDLLQTESQPYEILVFTETWLSHTTSNEHILIQNFDPPFRNDRVGRLGGGVAIYVRSGLYATRRLDLEILGLETLWIELTLRNKKLLVGGFYRPPDSNNEYWTLLEESIDRAHFHSNNVAITGDFNINVLNDQSNKISRLMSSYSSVQLISEPTHFTENSQSLIDLVFVNNPQHVISSFTADPFIPDLTRFHCPTVVVFKFQKPKITAFKRKIWKYDQADFDSYREELDQVDWDTLLNIDDLDSVADDLSNTILDIASKTIPSKIVTIRPADIPWFHSGIRKLIRQRNRLFRKAKIASEDTDKVNILNSYFCEQSNINDSNHSLPASPEQPSHILSSIHISQQDVTDAISTINPSKSCGSDMVSPRLLKEGSSVLAAPLAIFFNKLITESYFPSVWKTANVTPIYKKSNPSDPQNYRPISLLSCVGKLMERCIHKHFFNFLTQNNILSSYQSGFIRGDSTINQLVYIYNDICKAMDDGKEVRVVFCDISKAFDRVWHKGLLFKLSTIGVCGNLLQWFKSYLTLRKQRVVFANTSSDWSSISAGVPQGSILGPALFLVYINDIILNLRSNVRLFADDTSMYIIVDDPATSAATLNQDLETVRKWSRTWLVTFNPSKTETLTFSRKTTKPVHPDLYFDNVLLNPVSTHKHLGLTLSEDCKWNAHITNTVNKAWQRLALLRSFKYLLTRQNLERLYVSFIRPLLEYGENLGQLFRLLKIRIRVRSN
ncbi:uncharacterized protein LOC123527061 [Mercenaria mercenaria]|uniref:uncharacterized protein LOC123527061 n=1 Tax=Mercenaria mercenaria TaxID=6596 RepID=UPI00234E39EC|nr:uncharacterized protein LOC123527061 [Mercenaria mercenaria]